jgi:hypothetical protein
VLPFVLPDADLSGQPKLDDLKHLGMNQRLEVTATVDAPPLDLNHAGVQRVLQQRAECLRTKPVSIRDGETVARIDIGLPTGSAITGTIVDHHGEPIAGTLVGALQVRTNGDLAMAANASGVRERLIDDRGGYRLFGLLPGRFLVTASVDADVIIQDE